MSGYTLSKQDGSMLLALPPPLRGFTRSADLIGGVRVTAGGRRVQHRIAVKRTWSASWERLPEQTFGLIEAFWLGVHGLGPWLFVEPGQPAALVNITELEDVVQLLGFHSVRMTLLEV